MNNGMHRSRLKMACPVGKYTMPGVFAQNMPEIMTPAKYYRGPQGVLDVPRWNA
jgi:hypothetical protein